MIFIKYLKFLLSTLILIVATDKNLVYKKQLRGIIEKERNIQIQKIINIEYEKIYNKILQEAKICNHKLQFKILCFNIEEIDNKQNVFKFMYLSNNTDNEIFNIIKIYNIPINSIISKIIDKLKITFPDSSITSKPSNDKCLDYYFNYTL
jgi:hypothetical protein